MIAPKELVNATGHWKVAGRVYSEAIRLQRQGFGDKEAIEIATRNPNHWKGCEAYK